METHDVLARTARALARLARRARHRGPLQPRRARPTRRRIRARRESSCSSSTPCRGRARSSSRSPTCAAAARRSGCSSSSSRRNVPWGGALPHVEHKARARRAARVRLCVRLARGRGPVATTSRRLRTSNRERALPRRDRPADGGARVVGRQGARATTSRASIAAGGSASTSTRGSRATATLFSRWTSRATTSACGRSIRRSATGQPTSVHVGEPVDPRGPSRRSTSRSRPTAFAARRVRYLLETGRRSLGVEWLLEKEHVVDPESVYVAFPFALAEPRFRLDLNGVPCSPNEHQLERRRPRLVSGSPLGRRERRRARRHRRSARCAARAARRDHDRKGRTGAGPGRARS